MDRRNGDGGRAQPRLGQRDAETQAFQTMVRYPLGLDESACAESAQALNELLVETLVLRDLYKKHHWQASGPTFYMLHELFDKHHQAQSEIVDALAERVQLLGAVAVALPQDVTEASRIERAPKGREAPPVQISRLLEAHETILKLARKAAHEAEERGDAGTNDLVVSEVIRPNEMQVWFLAEHLVDVPLARAQEEPQVQPGQAAATQRPQPQPPRRS